MLSPMQSAHVHRLIRFLALGAGLTLATPTALSAETVLKSGDGEGYGSFGVDEFGHIGGCGGHGMVFDPFGPLARGQGNCRSYTFLFDLEGQWRQVLANGIWSYHPIFNATNGLRCIGSERPGDVLATDEYVLSDEVIGEYRRHTTFVVPGQPALVAELDQFVCGATLFQTYAFTNMSDQRIDMTVSRYVDADLDWASGWRKNIAGGVDEDNQAVRIATQGNEVGLTIDASGDARFDGWRAWHGGGGASDFARLMWQDGWTAAQLNQPYQSGGGPWCGRIEVPGGRVDDVGIGVQSVMSIEPGQRSVFGTRSALDPGFLPDSSVEVLGVTTTPAVLPMTKENTRVDLDVALEGCGICTVTGVHSDKPGFEYQIVGAAAVELLTDRPRTYSIELTCTDSSGGSFIYEAPIEVDPRARARCNQGIGNGPEGCDPGNSNQGDDANTNDEEGQLPGDPGKRGGRR